MRSAAPGLAPGDERADEGDRLVRLLRGRGAARPDRPDRLVGDHDVRQPLVLDRAEIGLDLVCADRLRRPGVALVLASRRRTGSARARRRAPPAPCAPAPRRSRRSSWRRSEWPRMTASTPSRRSIGAETSPVNAPSSLLVHVLGGDAHAALQRRARRRVRAPGTAGRAGPRSPARRRSPARNSADERLRLLVRLVASSSSRRRPACARRVMTPPRSRRAAPRTPGQRPALHQLQRGAAAGREPVTRSASPNADSAAAESPPPTTVVPGACGDRLGDARGCRRRTARARTRPSARSRTPSPRARDLVGVGLGRRGPDVEPHPAVGNLDRRRRSRRSASASKRSRDHEVDRQPQPPAGCARLLEHLAGELDPLLLDERVAGRDALGAEEAEAHRAADQDLVGGLEEALDDADLVAHLGAAEDDDERAARDRRGRTSARRPRARAAGRRRRAADARLPRSWRGRGARRRRRR